MADPTHADERPLKLLPQPSLNGRDFAVTPLPVPRTSFIGRVREVATASSYLRTSHGRLLTLTGPGGVGKTRLAIRIAEALAPEFPDGIAFAPLETLDDPDRVALAIAEALGVRGASGRNLAEVLPQALRESRMLLLLDNFERVVAGAAIVAELLTACPYLSILATSRIPLRVTGEQELPVPPLTIPDGEATLPHIMESDAVRLFAERAATVDPTFALNADTVAAVAAICRRLDGLPLAIELAAARSRLLAPHALSARLARSLPLLDGGPRDAPMRLRTMHDAIAWSHDLLPPAAQIVFRRLAVFQGGFTLEAADVVVTEPGIDTFASMDLLVEHSLVRRWNNTGEPRFGMLETVREYALDQLTANDEVNMLSDRHVTWMLHWAESLAPDPIQELGREQISWLARVEAEIPNLRAAIERLFETGDTEAVLRLLTWTDNFWTEREVHRDEVRRWLEAAFDPTRAPPTRLHAGALHVLICVTTSGPTYPDALRYAQRATEIGEELGDAFILGRAYYSLGLACEASGDGPGAETAYEQAVTCFRQIPLSPWLGAALGGQGDMRHANGDAASAVNMLDEGLATYRWHGQPWGISLLLGQRAHVALSQGDLPLAARLFLESLAAEQKFTNEWLALGAAAGLAGVAWRRGQPERAARLLGAIDAARERIGIVDVAHLFHAARITADIRASLGDRGFDLAWRAGHSRSYADVFAEATKIGREAQDEMSPDQNSNQYGMTVREREVLHLLAHGRTDSEIAAALFVSRRTAQTHVANIFKKLDVSNRNEATAIAHRAGLV